MIKSRLRISTIFGEGCGKRDRESRFSEKVLVVMCHFINWALRAGMVQLTQIGKLLEQHEYGPHRMNSVPEICRRAAANLLILPFVR